MLHTQSIPTLRNTQLQLFIGTLLILTVLIYGSPLLRIADPLASIVDLGVLSIIIFVLASFLVFVSISYWLLGLLWPTFRDFPQHTFSQHFKTLSPWQQTRLYLCSYFLFLYALLFLLHTCL